MGRQWLIVTESHTGTYTPFGSTLNWQPMPMPVRSYEVDTVSGCLWVIRDTLGPGSFICGVLGGNLYLDTPDGVVRVRPDGKADTCGFFTEEKTLEQFFNEVLQSEYARYDDNLLPTVLHGGACGAWMARAFICKMIQVGVVLPNRWESVRCIPIPTAVMAWSYCSPMKKNYRVDAEGRITPFIYRQPFKVFLDDGLESVEINTFYSGCFHHQADVIRCTRQGDRLYETQNTLE